MRCSVSMTAWHSEVVSSRGSRRPELDRQCTQARLQAYVSSQVKQIGDVSPSSNISVSLPLGRRPAVTVSAPAILRNAGDDAVGDVRRRGSGTIMLELARVARARP